MHYHPPAVSSWSPVQRRIQQQMTTKEKTNNKPPKQQTVRLQSEFASLLQNSASPDDLHGLSQKRVRPEFELGEHRSPKDMIPDMTGRIIENPAV